MIKSFKYFTVVLLVIIANFNFADSFASPGGGGSGSSNTPYGVIFDVLEQPGLMFLPAQTKTEFKICQIRRIFCGNMAIAIVAFAVFLVGILVMDRKISWPILLTITVGIVLFVNADKVARTFGKQNWVVWVGANPMCNCNCKLDDLGACVE